MDKDTLMQLIYINHKTHYVLYQQQYDEHYTQMRINVLAPMNFRTTTSFILIQHSIAYVATLMNHCCLLV